MPDMHEEIEQYRDIIRKILEAFEDVSFGVIIKVATDTDVEPFDQERDRDLIDDIKRLADETMHIYYRTPIRIRRINEVSNFLEREVPRIFHSITDYMKTIRDVIHFGGVGYPDIKIVASSGKVIYIDIKATTRPETGSARDFYITPLGKTKEKVSTSGKHAVLGFVIDGNPNNFRTIGWKLSDLSKIRIRMKPEFNADNLEIYKKEAIIAENYV